MKKGLWHAIAAYGLWGVLPIYWHLVRHVPPTQVLAHRIVWSCLFLALIIPVTRGWRDARPVLTARRTLLLSTVAALLIGFNWLTYVWAVGSGRVVEASLGYFINPLVTVLCGVLFLRERLGKRQWTALALAAAGVAFITMEVGAVPWAAIILAVTFALYALVKKLTPLGAMHSLAVETAILAPAALVFLFLINADGTGAFARDGAFTSALLAGTGIVTTVPLLFFASAARRIPLSTIGMLQYLSPTIQLLIGVFILGESFTPVHAIGFGCVWGAIALYSSKHFLARTGTAEA